MQQLVSGGQTGADRAGGNGNMKTNGGAAVKKWLVISCLCLCSVPAMAEENIAPRLFGVALGMTYDEARKVKEWLIAPARNGDGTTRGHFSEEIGDVTFNMTLTYNEEDKELLSIYAKYPSDSFDLVSQALTEKHGKGMVAKSTFQTGAGVAYEQITISWDLPGGHLSATRFAGTVTESAILLISQAGIEKDRQIIEQKVQILKKGL